ncbi:MAG: hypothetical protein NC237_10385, partial [Eubacterium sp.]|nr:hypothetical protein [Eubacterium sp.]
MSEAVENSSVAEADSFASIACSFSSAVVFLISAVWALVLAVASLIAAVWALVLAVASLIAAVWA